jgi:hypothetical protein
MSLISILGVLMIGGAVCVAFLAHRLLGIRTGRGNQVPAARVELAATLQAREFDGDVVKFVAHLQDQIFGLEEEIRELRLGALRVDERFLLADESRRLHEREMTRRQERELERRRERELERRRERELEESSWQIRNIKRPVATG